MTTLAFFINGPANLKEIMIPEAPYDFYVPVEPTTAVHLGEDAPPPVFVRRAAKYLRSMDPIWQPEYGRYYVEYVFHRIVGDLP